MYNLTDAPTQSQLAEAKIKLINQEAEAAELTKKIENANHDLAQLIKESTCAIATMENEKKNLEGKIAWTRAYISPIRRLPDEILREIFWFNFEVHPCCAWILSSVCSIWRRLVLRMPRIWSKIRLVTTPNASPDTIRLWLERSGSRVPLDIEIFLHVAGSSVKRPHSPWGSPPLAPVEWPHPLQNGLVHMPPPVHHGIHVMPNDTPFVVAAPHPVPPTPTWASPHSPRSSTHVRAGAHWGHIAMFYLLEQMFRWERFIFRFDKHFASIAALQSITGDAPLLKEFEVSSAEPVIVSSYANDWLWLPSATKGSAGAMPRLTSVTLQYLPFKWSSPMLGSNLRSVNLRSLPSVQIYLDRLLFIIASNPGLEFLSLHFQSAQPAVLPLSPTSLPELKELNLGGHYLLGTLLDTLNLPILASLTLDIEPRESLEDAITNLLTRSNSPPLTHLSLSYGSSLYYAGGAPLPWTFLTGLNHIRSLQIGQTSFESLVGALAVPDEDQNQWICPNLAHLSLRNCVPHGDGVSKLVMMVEARNPPNGAVAAAVQATPGWGPPVKLKRLEMYDCAPLGDDILKWLRSRIDEVNFTEPLYPRSPRSPSYVYL